MDQFWSSTTSNSNSCYKDFIVALKKWSKDTFENIFERKKVITKRLQGIDNLPSHRVSGFYI